MKKCCNKSQIDIAFQIPRNRARAKLLQTVAIKKESREDPENVPQISQRMGQVCLSRDTLKLTTNEV